MRIGLLIVLSESDFKYKFSRRVGNVLILNEIIFPEYTCDEIYHILRNRCEIGLLPDVISDDVIWSVADYSYRNFDLRGGIELLHSAVVLAEVEGAYEVNDWHIENTLPL